MALHSGVVLLNLLIIIFVNANIEVQKENIETDEIEQAIAELKQQFKTLGDDFKTLGEEIKEVNDEIELKFFQDFVNLNNKIKAGMGPLNRYIKMLDKINSKGASTEDKIEAIVSFITGVISEKIEDTMEIPPAEMTYGSPEYKCKLCMAQGTVTGLRSMKHSGTNVTSHADSLDLHLSYSFNNLHVHYDLLHLEIQYLPLVEGALNINLGRNEIELVLNIPKFKSFFNKILQKDCIIRLKDFSVKKLEYKNSHLEGRENERHSVLSVLMGSFLKINTSMLEKMFESKTLEEVRRSLQPDGNFVCNDKELADLVLRKGGSLDQSEAFNCGDVLVK